MREPRIHYPGAVYHVMSRGVERRVIFSSDTDRRTFLTYLISTIQRYNLSVFAYCLMGNHFHMLVAVRDAPLETAMKSLLSHYALYFNWTHERVGHLFQGRYGALLCKNLDYIMRLVAYIHMNPVRAGLAKSPAQWAWSSHVEFMRLSGPFLDLDQLEKLTGLEPQEARRRYLAHLQDIEREPRRDPTIQELLTKAAIQSGIDPADLVSGKRGAAYTCAKCLLVRWAGHHGYTDVEIAAALNCSPAAICLLRRRYGT